MIYATTEDISRMWRKLTMDEMQKSEAILPVVSDALRVEAKKVGKDLDEMCQDPTYANVVKSVVVDVTTRILQEDTHGGDAMSQITQSALGYSLTGTYLSPGGGLFIKNSELARLGLRRQKYGVIDLC